MVDANILFAGLIRQGITRKVLLSARICLFAPSFLRLEVAKHLPLLLRKSDLGSRNLLLFVAKLFLRIEFREDFLQWRQYAEATSPDENDSENFALALRPGIPFWSNDKRLKEQEIVRVYSTHELLGILPE